MPKKPVRIGSVELKPHVPTLVVPFTDQVPSLAELRSAHEKGLAFAEARVDLFQDRSAEGVRAVVRRVGRVLPVLLTVRSSKEGGAWEGDDAGRLALYRALLPDVAAVDVELAAAIRAEVVRAARRAGRTVVLSHHDFRGTPSDRVLDGVVARAEKAGADVTKIATVVPDDRAVARLAAVFARHPESRLVLIGMGAHGQKTRVFFPALGSLFTFTALGRSTAPGQLGFRAMLAELERSYPDLSAE
jgi:3-dehydroquinate dehydratase-1